MAEIEAQITHMAAFESVMNETRSRMAELEVEITHMAAFDSVVNATQSRMAELQAQIKMLRRHQLQQEFQRQKNYITLKVMLRNKSSSSFKKAITVPYIPTTPNRSSSISYPTSYQFPSAFRLTLPTPHATSSSLLPPILYTTYFCPLTGLTSTPAALIHRRPPVARFRHPPCPANRPV